MRVHGLAAGVSTLALWCAIGPVANALATDRHVGSGQTYATIQAAITAASAGDTILIHDGTYIGANNRDLNFGGKDLTVRSTDGADNCIIDVENVGGHRAFHFNSGDESVDNSKIIDITIRNGRVTGAVDGGAIRISGGSGVELQDCILTGNFAGRKGGAIYVYNSNGIDDGHGGIRMIRCTISSNHANVQGGAVALHHNSSGYFEDCTFSSNSSDGDGGAVWVLDTSNATFIGCTINDNDTDGASSTGGGLHVDGLNSSVRFEHGFIFGNKGSAGGGIYVNDADLYLYNSVVNTNNAEYSTGDGGAMYVTGDDATVEVESCTMYGNIANDWTGGIYINNAYHFSILNSIVWGSVQDASHFSTENTMRVITEPFNFSGHYCLMEDAPFDGSNGSNIYPYDPDLVAGGNGVLYVLDTTSPAIDFGQPNYSPWSLDIDGQDRLVDGPDAGAEERIDMGAWEYQ